MSIQDAVCSTVPTRNYDMSSISLLRQKALNESHIVDIIKYHQPIIMPLEFAKDSLTNSIDIHLWVVEKIQNTSKCINLSMKQVLSCGRQPKNGRIFLFFNCLFDDLSDNFGLPNTRKSSDNNSTV